MTQREVRMQLRRYAKKAMIEQGWFREFHPATDEYDNELPKIRSLLWSFAGNGKLFDSGILAHCFELASKDFFQTNAKQVVPFVSTALDGPKVKHLVCMMNAAIISALAGYNLKKGKRKMWKYAEAKCIDVSLKLSGRS